VIAVIIALATGFLGGIQYQKSQVRSSGYKNRQVAGSQNQNGGGPNRQNGQFQGRGNSGRIMGEILSIDDSSVTVKLTDGSSKIAIINDKTVYNKNRKELKRT